MYNHMVNVAVNNKCSSSDGKTKIDCSGYLLHTNNQETLNLLRYGSALCAPCDISGLVTEPGDISGVLDKCVCRIPMSDEMRRVLYYTVLESPKLDLDTSDAAIFVQGLQKYGIGPDFFYLPWNPFEKPGGNNAERIYWTPPCDDGGMAAGLIPVCHDPPTTFELQDASSGRFGSCPFDGTGLVGGATAGIGSVNLLPFIDASGDCSGATCGPTLVNIYGAYMNIFDIDANFGNTCGSTYLPAGTFAFRLKDVLSAWLYLWEPILMERVASDAAAMAVGAIDNHGVLQCSTAIAGAVGALGAETFLLYLMVCWFHGLGIYAARPPTTIDNYLNDFAQNTPLRIYRSKYWHTHA